MYVPGTCSFWLLLRHTRGDVSERSAATFIELRHEDSESNIMINGELIVRVEGCLQEGMCFTPGTVRGHLLVRSLKCKIPILITCDLKNGL